MTKTLVIHTGGSRYLARLIRRGYVQAILAGNGFAAHDIEQSLFGTSLGVDLKRGINVQGGHQHHLRAINMVRGHGSIAHGHQILRPPLAGHVVRQPFMDPQRRPAPHE